jgi:hypothetical protein
MMTKKDRPPSSFFPAFTLITLLPVLLRRRPSFVHPLFPPRRLLNTTTTTTITIKHH